MLNLTKAWIFSPRENIYPLTQRSIFQSCILQYTYIYDYWLDNRTIYIMSQATNVIFHVETFRFLAVSSLFFHWNQIKIIPSHEIIQRITFLVKIASKGSWFVLVKFINYFKIWSLSLKKIVSGLHKVSIGQLWDLQMYALVKDK